MEAAEATFHELSHMPEMGAPRYFDNPSLVGLRMFPLHEFSKYLVFYRSTQGGIEVVRVLWPLRYVGAFRPRNLCRNSPPGDEKQPCARGPRWLNVT